LLPHALIVPPSHTAVDFFNHLNMLYGTVTEFCTNQEVSTSSFSIFLPARRFIVPSRSVPSCLPAHGAFLPPGDRACLNPSACTRYEYLWEDGVKYRRPTKLPAPEYVDALMNWAQALLDDDTVFPNATSIAALLDRLTHHADVTLIEGTSYRVRESELEAAARKKLNSEGKPPAH